MVRAFNVDFPTRTVVLLAGEAAIISAAFLFAALIQFGSDFALVVGYENGWYRIALPCGILLFCMYYYDLYESHAFCDLRQLIIRLIQVLGTWYVIIALTYYVFPQSRLAGAALDAAILFFGLALLLWRKLFLALNSSGRLAEPALILGDGPLSMRLSQELANRPEWGVRLAGYVGKPWDTEDIASCPCLGNTEDLAAVVERERIREVIVAVTERRGCLPLRQLAELRSQGVVVLEGIAVYESLTGKVALDSSLLSRLLFSPGFQISLSGQILRSALSFVFSVMCLVLALPVMMLTALAVRLDSEGPVLLSQERVGKDGKIFKLLKFRSMKLDADPDKAAEHNDVRFTRLGKWMRRCRLDELPQLYNILRGDMHFVGPRPFVPRQEWELSQKIPFYQQRWVIKPGATGWAQIHHGYCTTLEDNVEKLAYDLYYIKNMSIRLDLLIIFQSLKTVLLGRGGR